MEYVGFMQLILKIIILYKNQVLYGFRTKVALVENKPCTIGTTCRGQPEDLRQDQNPFPKGQNQFAQSQKQMRQELNQFTSDQNQITPDLDQFIKDPNWFSTAEEISSYEEDQSSLKAKWFNQESRPILLDRQSGEEFQSDGPPDCRVIRTQCPPSR